MSIINKLLIRLKVISIYGLSQSITPLGHLLISYFIIKFKTIAFWGSYVEVLIWVNLILLMLSFGNKSFLLKEFSKIPAKLYQLWFSNFLNRSILLIPCFLIIIFTPFFKDKILLTCLWLVLLFISQSYQVLLLYLKDFKYSLLVEIVFNSSILMFVFLKIDTLDLLDFLSIVVFSNLIKATFFIIYYFKKMKGLSFKINLFELKKNVPYFIPLTLGTVRVKIDTYFANTFFSVSDLGKYQILISFISIGHITTTYFVNPYLKVFFRVSDSIIKKIKRQSFIFGVFYGLTFVIATYFIISKVYLIQFTFANYITVFTFFIPLLFQMILVNQIYKYDQQNLVSYVALFVIFLQIIIGYYLIQEQGIQGALLLKASSQWLITLLLWFWFRKVKNNKFLY
jgi:hypothetical protein